MIKQWLQRWRGTGSGDEEATLIDDEHNAPLQRAARSLQALLDDPSIPPAVREALAADYADLQAMLEKLEHGALHIAVFGRVSVGKSALLNALLGHEAFAVGVLHGTTQHQSLQHWKAYSEGGLHLIDTPGINELDGEAREALAFEVAARSDLLLFVVDGDMSNSEHAALIQVAATNRPLLLVLNKADRYSRSERDALLQRLRERVAPWIPAEQVLACSGLPAERRVIRVAADGSESESLETPAPDIDALRERVLAIMRSEGKTLAALNAALFAGQLSDEVAKRITEARAEIAARVVRTYCLTKGIAVAVNPIPVADLLAAASLDVALVVHLGKVYGLPVTRREASSLVLTIAAQLAALMGAIWGVHLVSSALKGISIGLSTALTAGAQGALAWYATLLVGRAAERYFVQGRSWGPDGPKQVVQDILNSLDRNSVLREAKTTIEAKLSAR